MKEGTLQELFGADGIGPLWSRDVTLGEVRRHLQHEPAEEKSIGSGFDPKIHCSICRRLWRAYLDSFQGAKV